jgi:hypothetical protein
MPFREQHSLKKKKTSLKQPSDSSPVWVGFVSYGRGVVIQPADRIASRGSRCAFLWRRCRCNLTLCVIYIYTTNLTCLEGAITPTVKTSRNLRYILPMSVGGKGGYESYRGHTLNSSGLQSRFTTPSRLLGGYRASDWECSEAKRYCAEQRARSLALFSTLSFPPAPRLQ